MATPKDTNNSAYHANLQGAATVQKPAKQVSSVAGFA